MKHTCYETPKDAQRRPCAQRESEKGPSCNYERGQDLKEKPRQNKKKTA